MSTPPVVLAALDVEGALECAALGPALIALGVDVQLAAADPRDRVLIERLLSTPIAVKPLEPLIEEATYIVFASTDEVASRVAARIGHDSVLLRVTGIESFRAYRRGATRRFRAPAQLFLRSRLEMAELGDRTCEHIPSGVTFAAHTATKSGEQPVLFVPRSLENDPTLPQWSGRASGYPVALASIEELSGPVILPVCDEVAIFDALGTPYVLFDPNFDAAPFTRRWNESHQVEKSLDAVSARLGAAAHNTSDPLVSLRDDSLTVSQWAGLFIQALQAE